MGTELSLRTTPANTTSSSASTATTSQQRLSDLSAHFDPRTNTANMSTEAVGDFGLIGLAVMGQNLIMNAADHGFNVVAFNRTVSKVDRFLDNEAKGKSIVGAKSLEDFVAKLKKPSIAVDRLAKSAISHALMGTGDEKKRIIENKECL